MKAKEIKELTTNELVERLAEERQNLNRLVLNHAIAPLENTSLIRETRRTIARMETILTQRNNQQ